MAQLIGLATIGRDAEIRYLSNGDAVTNLSLAFNYGRKGEDGKRPTQWVDAALFGKRAESLSQYLLKGSAVTVTGSVTEREWTDKEGQKRKSMDVRVNDIALQGGKRDAAPQAAPAQRTAPAQRQAPVDDFDSSDIPF